LQWLYLNNNQLSSLPASITGWKSLNYLNLSNNPSLPVPQKYEQQRNANGEKLIFKTQEETQQFLQNYVAWKYPDNPQQGQSNTTITHAYENAQVTLGNEDAGAAAEGSDAGAMAIHTPVTSKEVKQSIKPS